MLARRNFLKLLGLSSLLPLLHFERASARSSSARIVLSETYLAGFCHHEGMRPEVFRILAVGDELILRRQPDNPHDCNAIGVYTRRGSKLGYVPRKLNRMPAAIADQDIRIGANIVGIEPDAPTWQRVRVRVWEEV